MSKVRRRAPVGLRGAPQLRLTVEPEPLSQRGHVETRPKDLSSALVDPSDLADRLGGRRRDDRQGDELKSGAIERAPAHLDDAARRGEDEFDRVGNRAEIADLGVRWRTAGGTQVCCRYATP